MLGLSGRTMGTSWQVTYVAAEETVSRETLQQEAASILFDINASMSTYRRNSEISLLNKAPVDVWVPVSPEFFEVLSAALLVGEATAGAYDVTVGPLVDRWGFGPGHEPPDIPPQAEREMLLQIVGQGKLQVDPEKPAVLKPVELSLDLSSIAKGYAVDKLAEYLESEGVKNYLVEVGGEIRVAGLSGRGDPWRIAIEKPDGGAREVASAISLSDIAIATSGDYRNFFELDGKRFAHIIDPRNGHPVEHDLVSVTVLHPSAMIADAWATALTVLGADEAMALASEQELAVYFIRREGDGFTVSQTAGFAPYLQATGQAE